MFLATTADNRFWGIGQKIVFLGEWCKTYKNKKLWKDSEHLTNDYHWKNKRKFDKDFVYLEKVYEKYLFSLSEQMNLIHNKNFSKKYWRILIGPWLKGTIDATFDRSESLKKVKRTKLITNTYICNTSPLKPYTPINPSQDSYNLYLISCIIEILNLFPYEKKNINIFDTNEVPVTKRSYLRHFKKPVNILIRQALAVIKGRLIPYFFYRFKNKIIVGGDIFLNTKYYLLLQIRLKKILPVFQGVRIYINPVYAIPLREKLKFKFKEDEFHFILNKIIPKIIPSVYVEYYKNFNNISIHYGPKNAKYSIHASNINYLTSYEFWMAHHMEKNNMKILTIQHGGGYGTMRKCFLDRHYSLISDKYFTWGSFLTGKKNIKPLPSFRLIQSKEIIKNNNPKGSIMWIQTSYSRYKHHAESNYSGPEMIDYINDQKIFYDNLNPEVRKLLIWRKFTNLWDEENRFKEFAPNLSIQHAEKKQLGKESDFEVEIQKCRLSIHTANETTYLQTLASNFPTLVFWDKNVYQLHESHICIFQRLVEAKILHYCPKSCAQQLNKIYSDPVKWWNEKNIQESREFFCNNLAKTENIFFDEWVKVIDKL